MANFSDKVKLALRIAFCDDEAVDLFEQDIKSVASSEIADGAVTNSKIADLAVSTGKIAALAVNAGKLASDAVETLKIKDANVTKAKLASGISANYMLLYVGSVMSVGGAASEDFAVLGALATDYVIAVMETQGVGVRTILEVKPGVDKFTVVFSGDPSNDHRITYFIARATS